ncbi:MAG: response regulator [Chloroflexota bacterium]
MSPRPYQRVYAELRARIDRGELAPGSRLPPQSALAAELHTQPLAVRHAIELLRRSGYLVSERGSGPLVAPTPPADTVLVVDDDARLRAILLEHAAFAGYRVLEAGDGEEALEILQRERVALVFTDLRMPRLDGIGLLRQARPRYPDVVFVVVSGFEDQISQLYGTDVFPITVIPKPFRAEQIRRALGLIRAIRAGAGAPAETPLVDLGEREIGSLVPEDVNVLVVDDDASQRALLVATLRMYGFSAAEAADGESALELIDQQSFTHVFLDFRMPGLGGAEVASRIRERDDQLVIVFLSAYPEDVVRSRGSGDGPLPILGKPFDPADILATLRLSLSPTEPLQVPRTG